MAKNLKEILSPRQYEVVCALAQGLDNNAIANSMGTTPGNVSVLLTTICKRLGITSKTGVSFREQLVKFVKENAALNLEEQDEINCRPGGGAMPEEIETSVLQPEKANNPPKNETIRRISKSVEAVDIVQKVNEELVALYLEIGRAYLKGRLNNCGESTQLVQKAKRYEEALNVINEVTSCKE